MFGVAFEGGRLCEDLYESLLQHVFSVIVADDDAAYVPVEPFAIGLCEQSEAILFHALTAEHTDNPGVGVRAFHWASFEGRLSI